MNTNSYRYAEHYPSDALASAGSQADVIAPESAGSIPGAFAERIRRSPEAPAYLQWSDGHWVTQSWREFGEAWGRWRAAFASEGLDRGSRVMIRAHNCLEWVLFDQGAMANGLVVVPVFAEDRADNIAYIARQTEARLLMVESLEQWEALASELGAESVIQKVIVMTSERPESTEKDDRVVLLEDWLPQEAQSDSGAAFPSADDLATIVFTSGTTGRPKGVMLSHANILKNAFAGLQSFVVFPQDRMLSFLPLSHMFERTIGCYLNVMAGSSVAFNRSIPELLDDMAEVKPTILITVPRIFERAYGRIQDQLEESSSLRKWMFNQAVEAGWRHFEMRQGRAGWSPSQILRPLLNRLVGSKVRQRFGGNLRVVVSGGAPLAARISRVFIGLGVEILQGYGLTESSPVLSVNTLAHNKPHSIGLPLLGTRLRVAPDGELQASGPFIMQGYWLNAEATAETVDEDGWLHTGDVATIDDDGFVSITGRIKEIIVMATGEKVPPADMESAICDDPVFEQAMVVGEGKPFLSLIAVINPDAWERATGRAGVGKDPDNEAVKEWVVGRIAGLVHDFPGYANIHQVTLTTEPWTVEDGSLTPTLKLKRPVIRERFTQEIENMYAGH